MVGGLKWGVVVVVVVAKGAGSGRRWGWGWLWWWSSSSSSCVCVCVRARGWMARVGHASVCGRDARVLCAVVAVGQGRGNIGRGWVGGVAVAVMATVAVVVVVAAAESAGDLTEAPSVGAARRLG